MQIQNNVYLQNKIYLQNNKRDLQNNKRDLLNKKTDLQTKIMYPKSEDRYKSVTISESVHIHNAETKGHGISQWHGNDRFAN